MSDWHKKPPERVRPVNDALHHAEKKRDELPKTVQVTAYDWDIVILADEIYRLRKMLSEQRDDIESES